MGTQRHDPKGATTKRPFLIVNPKTYLGSTDAVRLSRACCGRAPTVRAAPAASSAIQTGVAS
jgi:hypothetical protein